MSPTGHARPAADTLRARQGDHPERRSTRQRTAIATALTDRSVFLSAQEIHTRLRQAGKSVGLATVYRNLQAMATDGEVDVMRTEDGECVYRACSSGHHHHLVCRECGRTVEVAERSIEAWAERVGAEHGFTDVTHLLEVVGTCADCSR